MFSMSKQLAAITILCAMASSFSAHSAEPPLGVDAAVAYALQNNPDLQTMRQDPAMAAARLEMARAAGRLTVSTSAFATAATRPMILSGVAPVMPQYTTSPGAGRQATLGAMAMYPLSTGGRVEADKRQKAGELLSAEEAIHAAENDLAYRVRVAYKKVLLAQLVVDIHKDRVAETTERLRIDQAKFDVGKIPLVFVLRDKAELADATQGLTNAKRDVELAFLDLKVAMGAPLATDVPLADKLAYNPGSQDAEALVKEALQRRPELRSAQAKIAAAEAGVQSARSAYRAQWGLTAMGEVMHNSNDGDAGQYLVGIVASLPLLDGGMRKAQVGEATANLTQQQRQVVAQRLSVEKDVRTAIANLNAADQSTRTSMEAVAQAEEDHRVAKLRYDAGKGILVEVLDSLTSLVRARVNYAQALYDYSTALDDLDRAVGRR